MFEKYLNDLKKDNQDSLIFKDFLAGMNMDYIEHHAQAEVVRDFISGMTDSYLIRQSPAHLRPQRVEYV